MRGGGGIKKSTFNYTTVKRYGRICKLGGILRRSAVLEKPGDAASQSAFVVLEFEKPLKVNSQGALNNVYVCGNTDQPFIFG